MKFTIRGPSLFKVLDRYHANLNPAIKKGLVSSSKMAVGVIRDTIKNQWVGVSDTGLSTGALADSFKPKEWTSSGNTHSVVIGPTGPAAVYANIHEVGGIIRPKRGLVLTIPLERAEQFFPDVQPERIWNGMYVINKAEIRPKRYIVHSLARIRYLLPANFTVSMGKAWDAATSGT